MAGAGGQERHSLESLEVTAAEMNQSIAAFEQDIATGRWRATSSA
jgi:hypothetical protein